MTWIQYRTGSWHAWTPGGTSTVCGQVTVDDLYKHPALAVSDEPPEPAQWDKAPACLACLKATKGEEEEGSEEVADEWVGKIKLRARRARVKLNKEDVEDFADLLVRVGSINDPDAVEVFEQVASVLLKPVTQRKRSRAWRIIPHFRDALAKIPPRRDRLLHLAHTINLWRQLTGRTPQQDRFRPDYVVGSMLEIPDPEPYIRRLIERDMAHLSSMFHPNTLARAKKDTQLRGVFWGGAKHKQDTLDGVRVIE